MTGTVKQPRIAKACQLYDNAVEYAAAYANMGEHNVDVDNALNLLEMGIVMQVMGKKCTSRPMYESLQHVAKVHGPPIVDNRSSTKGNIFDCCRCVWSGWGRLVRLAVFELARDICAL